MRVHKRFLERVNNELRKRGKLQIEDNLFKSIYTIEDMRNDIGYKNYFKYYEAHVYYLSKYIKRELMKDIFDNEDRLYNNMIDLIIEDICLYDPNLISSISKNNLCLAVYERDIFNSDINHIAKYIMIGDMLYRSIRFNCGTSDIDESTANIASNIFNKSLMNRLLYLTTSLGSAHNVVQIWYDILRYIDEKDSIEFQKSMKLYEGNIIGISELVNRAELKDLSPELQKQYHENTDVIDINRLIMSLHNNESLRIILSESIMNNDSTRIKEILFSLFKDRMDEDNKISNFIKTLEEL